MNSLVNPLGQLDWRVMLSVATIVVLTFVILRRVFVGPYLKVMEARQQFLDESEASDRQSARILAEARAEADSILGEAHRRAEHALAEERAQTETYRSEHIEKANIAAARKLERGRRKIRAESDAELDLLRQRAVDCVGAACQRLAVPVNERITATAVDDAMARMRL